MAELTHVSMKRKTIRDHVVRHPMVAFIALTYAITWITWPLNKRFDLGTVNGLGIISLAGPALAAMIISALLKPEPSAVPASKRWRLFAILSSLAVAVMTVVHFVGRLLATPRSTGSSTFTRSTFPTDSLVLVGDRCGTLPSNPTAMIT